MAEGGGFVGLVEARKVVGRRFSVFCYFNYVVLHCHLLVNDINSFKDFLCMFFVCISGSK